MWIPQPLRAVEYHRPATFTVKTTFSYFSTGGFLHIPVQLRTHRRPNCYPRRNTHFNPSALRQERSGTARSPRPQPVPSPSGPGRAAPPLRFEFGRAALGPAPHPIPAVPQPSLGVSRYPPPSDLSSGGAQQAEPAPLTAQEENIKTRGKHQRPRADPHSPPAFIAARPRGLSGRTRLRKSGPGRGRREGEGGERSRRRAGTAGPTRPIHNAGAPSGRRERRELRPARPARRASAPPTARAHLF